MPGGELTHQNHSDEQPGDVARRGVIAVLRAGAGVLRRHGLQRCRSGHSFDALTR